MIAAITCFFNPCSWFNRTKNLIKFRRHFDGCDLFIAEASYNNDFVFSDTIHIHANEGNRYIWQKERMLNHIAEQLPDKYDKIAWIDCDVIFENQNWANEANELLDSEPVIQLFQYVDFLGVDGVVDMSWPSMGQWQRADPSIYHPGFAWATRRENFPLYDVSICGSGDLCMAQWWLGNPATQHTFGKSTAWQLDSLRASFRYHNMTKGKLGCTTGKIRHLFHGTMDDRCYHNLSQAVGNLGYDPNKDIALDDNGLWKWTNNNPELRRFMTTYFHGRNEDKAE